MLQQLFAFWTKRFEHPYVSTYCVHEKHESCRKVCKFCPSLCRCPCHKQDAVVPPPVTAP